MIATSISGLEAGIFAILVVVALGVIGALFVVFLQASDGRNSQRDRLER
jgi:hypothetical protein